MSGETSRIRNWRWGGVLNSGWRGEQASESKSPRGFAAIL